MRMIQERAVKKGWLRSADNRSVQVHEGEDKKCDAGRRKTIKGIKELRCQILTSGYERCFFLKWLFQV